MVGLAIAIFVMIFGFGNQLFGWYDPTGHVQLALFTSFVTGIVCGYRTRS